MLSLTGLIGFKHMLEHIQALQWTFMDCTGFWWMHSEANCVHWVKFRRSHNLFFYAYVYSICIWLKSGALQGIISLGGKILAESKPVDCNREQPVLSPQRPTIPPPSLPHKWQHIQLPQRLNTFPIYVPAPLGNISDLCYSLYGTRFLLFCDLCVPFLWGQFFE